MESGVGIEIKGIASNVIRTRSNVVTGFLQRNNIIRPQKGGQ